MTSLQLDLRLSVAIALISGLMLVLGKPEGFYYAPLSALLLLSGTYGGTAQASRERFYGTLLGAAVYLLVRTTLDLPLEFQAPIGMGAIWVLGYLCGLSSGYKVAGTIYAIGLTSHRADWVQWLPHRVVMTSVGLLLTLVIVRCFWPSRTLDQLRSLQRESLQALAGMTRQLAGQLEQLLATLGEPERPTPLVLELSQAIVRRNRISGLRGTARLEFTSDLRGRLISEFWQVLEDQTSIVIAALRTLSRLPPGLYPVDSPLRSLQQAQQQVLTSVADWLEQAAANLPKAPRERTLVPLETALSRLDQLEADLMRTPSLLGGDLQLRNTARRLVALRQLAEAIRVLHRSWPRNLSG